jgi:choloylglycine hydrolase
VRIEDPAPPVHFLIADARGHCAVIEWLGGKFVCHTGKTLPVKALSNSIYDQALGIYKRGGSHWWERDRGLTNERFAKAAERNAGYKTSGESNPIKYAFGTLTKVVAAEHTKWNIVYDISKRQIFFRSVASPTLKYLSLRKMRKD